MRHAFVPTLTVAIAGVLVVLYFTLSTSFGSETFHRIHNVAIHDTPTTPSPSRVIQSYHTPSASPAREQHSHESPSARLARVLNNPYNEWYYVWLGQNFTHTLVVAALKSENISWVDGETSDIANLQKAVYFVDDDARPLHTPANKGNEAMAYLSYIIDYYDDLPDVSTFMHFHRGTWHISELLDRSSAESLRRLSLEKVHRDGYVNLRCDLAPGCPVSAQLDRLGEGDSGSHMSQLLVDTLGLLFPDEPLPTTLAQACCAQFAASRKLLQRHPKEYYIALRDWLLTTDYPNQVSGRVFEYIWAWLLTSQPVFCPNEHICWCDTYGVCFETREAWDEYNNLIRARKAIEPEESSFPPFSEDPRRVELRGIIDGLYKEETRRKGEAFLAGTNLARRQTILSDAWETLKARGEL